MISIVVFYNDYKVIRMILCTVYLSSNQLKTYVHITVIAYILLWQAFIAILTQSAAINQPEKNAAIMLDLLTLTKWKSFTYIQVVFTSTSVSTQKHLLKFLLVYLKYNIPVLYNNLEYLLEWCFPVRELLLDSVMLYTKTLCERGLLLCTPVMATELIGHSTNNLLL